MARSVWVRLVGLLAATIFVTACGGQTSSPVPQGSVASARVHRGSGSYGDLLYVSSSYGITMVSYPELQIVGAITNQGAEGGMCSDPRTGNVLFPESHIIVEYAHGGTRPIATLHAPTGYFYLSGCSVDPTTGSVAVSSSIGPSKVIVFPGGQDNPIVYGGKILHDFGWTAYDNSGNLFVTFRGKRNNFFIGELPVGQSTFTQIKWDGDEIVGKLQWDGTYLVYSVPDPKQGATMYQLAISNGTATVAGTVHLLQAGQRLFWIHDGTVFQSYWKVKHNKDAAVAGWSYPKGGRPTFVLYGVAEGKKVEIEDVTYSVAPSK